MEVVINKLGNTGSNSTNTENIAGKIYNGLELKSVYMFTWKKNTTNRSLPIYVHHIR